uniref:Uncharacterized protein n=1 Tax=Mycena chlorophos TaxID=658473 RepID=A0ABQ0M5N3_MYCCL|nr:predicted protein [Mycena chlorophos]
MLAEDDTLDPRFPPALERMIFELAATASPKSVVRLGLVAWRVHRWFAFDFSNIGSWKKRILRIQRFRLQNHLELVHPHEHWQ